MAFYIPQIVRSRGEQGTSDPISAIDYFGPAGSRGQTDAACGAEAEDAVEDAVEAPREVEGGRRKRKTQDLTVKSKKKKKAVQVDTVEGR